MNLADIKPILARMEALTETLASAKPFKMDNPDYREREAIHAELDARLKPEGFAVIYNYLLHCYSVRVLPL